MNQRGFAILFSLLFVLFLTVYILETHVRVRADLRAAGNFRDDQAAFFLAQSGLSAGRAILEKDFQDGQRVSETYDGLNELWAYPVPEYPLGGGTLSGMIVDEMSKINLNAMIDASGNAIGPRIDLLRRLFENLNVPPELVDAIVDYIDADDLPRPRYGVEEGYYRGLNPPYSTKNRAFDTLAEFRMVRGVTDEIYRKIIPYVTVYKIQGNDPAGKLNINTTTEIVLRSLDREIDEREARRLMESRPYKKPQEFQNKLLKVVSDRMGKDISDWLDVKSEVFSINSYGQVNGIRKAVSAMVYRKGARVSLLDFRVE